MPDYLSTVFNIEIDKLTNSIENAISGEVFDTEITRLTVLNEKEIKKKDWVFNWKQELKDSSREVYKLTTTGNKMIIQGLLSLEDKGDHVFMHLLESAKFNQGKQKYTLVSREILLPMPAN